MRFLDRISEFFRDEDGAITVDWVVLTAAVVVLSVFVIATIDGALTTTSVEIVSVIDSAIS
ncbi:MAG: hypothetical protein L3J05_10460 [Robiginitomaculum sp.]|nr:hypothetical protein [Robiginitomaculum sp.]